jgi:hypothetical protein
MNLGCAAVDVRRALTATELCAARENREVPVEDLSKMAVGARQMQEKFPRRNWEVRAPHGRIQISHGCISAHRRASELSYATRRQFLYWAIWSVSAKFFSVPMIEGR